MYTGEVGAVIVAAGQSTRMGADKLLASLGGRPLLAYALRAFDAAPAVGRIALVTTEERIDAVRRCLGALALTTPCTIVIGGSRRRDSVLAGAHALQGCDWVLVHDAARPLVSRALIEAALEAARPTGAAIPGIPVTDTIKQVDAAGHVRATLDRGELRAIQTPQAFRLQLLLDAHAASDDDAPDDAGLVERLGVQVRVFPGDPRNLKVTVPADLRIAEALLEGAFG